jgi:transcriptional regulator with XRE-family HTH domain
VDDAALGFAIRAQRLRRGWQHIDLSRRARVSRSQVSDVETGRVDRLTLVAARRLAGAVGVRLEWDLRYQVPAQGRLHDEDHAWIADWLVQELESSGWQVAAEASFNHYGERGRVDILACHPASRILLAVEVKTVVADVQDLRGNLDVKARVAPMLARARGWSPRLVVPALVIAEETTNRRRVSSHAHLFARFSIRGLSAARWLR